MVGVLLVFSMLAYVGGNSVQQYPYPQAVQVAEVWMAQNTPAGTLSLAVNEQLFTGMNATYPGHDAIYKPFDQESPVTASYDAIFHNATYLIITDLQGDGYTYDQNYAWRQFTSDNLDGAELIYSNDYVHVFQVVEF